MILLAVFAIVGGISAGFWLHRRFGSGGADAAYDGLALISSFFWILTGIFLVLGGFVVPGVIVLVIFSYVGISKGINTKQRIRSRIAG